VCRVRIRALGLFDFDGGARACAATFWLSTFWRGFEQMLLCMWHLAAWPRSFGFKFLCAQPSASAAMWRVVAPLAAAAQALAHALVVTGTILSNLLRGTVLLNLLVS
jgi:hypothetical protein